MGFFLLQTPNSLPEQHSPARCPAYRMTFVEIVFLRPAEGGIVEMLLDDGMKPGQQEVEPSSLVGFLGGGH